jgi:predicted nucleic-acid-binding protein
VTGLDTNVLVRYVMQDDAKQAARATKVVEALTDEAPGFVSLVSLVEFVWVLETSYEVPRAGVAQSLTALLAARELVVDRVDEVRAALRAYRESSADFADALIARIGAEAGCSETVTFDVHAAKNAGMRLLAA